MAEEAVVVERRREGREVGMVAAIRHREGDGAVSLRHQVVVVRCGVGEMGFEVAESRLRLCGSCRFGEWRGCCHLNGSFCCPLLSHPPHSQWWGCSPSTPLPSASPSFSHPPLLRLPPSSHVLAAAAAVAAPTPPAAALPLLPRPHPPRPPSGLSSVELSDCPVLCCGRVLCDVFQSSCHRSAPA